MKYSLAGIIALLTFAAVNIARAADMAVKAPPPQAPAPVYSWTGFYIGAAAGVAWDHADVNLDPVNGALPNYRPQDIPGVIALGTQNFSGTNAIFGGKIGYNRQFSAWVVGLEADFSSFHFGKSSLVTGNPFPGFGPGFMTLNTNVSTNWLATVRPRIGYAFDHTLFFVTGGAAFGRASFSNTDLELAPNGLGFGNEASAASQTRTGWTVGAGLDYALATNWIVSVEYLHVDLGSLNASGLVTSAAGLAGATATLNFSTKLTSDLARAGIAYKF
jgi:outer membrane immunogenic protein